MRKYLLFFIALASIAFGVCSPADAQFATIGCQGGKCGGSGGGGYTGPGDVVSGASAWWGLRCYNNAYNGNLADITNSATGSTTGTRLQCSTGNVITALVSGSACTFVTGNACSSLATTCATACNVRELYDQSGNTNHLVQSGNSARPAFTQNCLNTTLPCMTFTTASNLSDSTAMSVAQPNTISMVIDRTAAAFTDYLTANGDNTGMIAPSSANTIELYNAASGASSGVTVSDNAWHAIQGIANGAGSSIQVDATPNTGLSVGTTAFGAGGPDFGQNGFTGKAAEFGIWPIGFSGTQQTNMCHNQFTYWATSTSC